MDFFEGVAERAEIGGGVGEAIVAKGGEFRDELEEGGELVVNLFREAGRRRVESGFEFFGRGLAFGNGFVADRLLVGIHARDVLVGDDARLLVLIPVVRALGEGDGANGGIELGGGPAERGGAEFEVAILIDHGMDGVPVGFEEFLQKAEALV